MQYAVDQALHRDLQARQENSYDLAYLENLIVETVQHLPEQGRRVFELQRSEGLSYQEIADHLFLRRKQLLKYLNSRSKIR